MFDDLRNEIKNAGSPERAKASMWFFKTGKGQYGEGDVFVGISVPDQRKIAFRYKSLPLPDIAKLLDSKIHEERLIALLILVSQFTKGDRKTKKERYEFYLSHTKFINNWDLVDLSAHKIVGAYLVAHPEETKILTQLARSKVLWERRIAIISTFAFLGKGDGELSLKVADILLHDTHDLIHKAVGWTLREVGKRVSQELEEDFLKSRYKTMPRTALRYAIEHFPEQKRKKYLQGII